MNKAEQIRAKRKAKGNKAWKPATFLDVPNKDPNFRYRWEYKDPQVLQKALLEGWEIDRTGKCKINPGVDLDDIDDNNTTGRLKSSVTEYRELILTRIPEEVAKERDEYYEMLTDKQDVTPKNIRHVTKRMFDEAGLDSSTLYDNTTVID